jgi:uncharacterized protein (TIGR00251 family)
VIRVKVLPRSSRNEMAGKADGAYRIKLTAPPVEGKANKALINFLAKKTGLPKRKFQIVSGEHSRNKTVRIQTLSSETSKMPRRRISPLLQRVSKPILRPHIVDGGPFDGQAA